MGISSIRWKSLDLSIVSSLFFWFSLLAPEEPAFDEPADVSTTGTSVNVTVWSASQNNGPIRYSKINKLNINRVFFERIVSEAHPG